MNKLDKKLTLVALEVYKSAGLKKGDKSTTEQDNLASAAILNNATTEWAREAIAKRFETTDMYVLKLAAQALERSNSLGMLPERILGDLGCAVIGILERSTVRIMIEALEMTNEPDLFQKRQRQTKTSSH